MEVVLEDNGLKEFIDQEIPKPTSTNAQDLAEWKKCVTKVREIILEGVQDHIISILHGKDTPFSMWKTLKDLYQNSSDQRKLVLKDKLRRINMEKGNTISTYLNKLTTYKDELGSVGITTFDDYMILCKRRSGGAHKMVLHPRMMMKKIWPLQVRQEKGRGRLPIPNQILLMDRRRVTCLNEASFHMTGDKELFSALEEKDLKMCIEMGDDENDSVLGVGTIAFQREHGPPITLKDVMIFGSSIYFHVTKDARKKLEPTVEFGILVGYTDTPHSYQVYFPTSRRKVVCRDLRFDEQKAMRASLERELQLQDVEELFVHKEEEPQIGAE
eukprot:PITA_08552